MVITLFGSRKHKVLDIQPNGVTRLVEQLLIYCYKLEYSH